MTKELQKQETKVLSRKEEILANYHPDDVELIKRTIANGATNDELALFLTRCHSLELDPWRQEVWFIKMAGKVVIMTSIHGLRELAERSGKHQGTEIEYNFNEVGALISATALVHREGWKFPAKYTAFFEEYNLNNARWKQAPKQMLGKCAEAGALRMARLVDTVYTDDEMREPDEPKNVTPVPDIKEAESEDITGQKFTNEPIDAEVVEPCGEKEVKPCKESGEKEPEPAPKNYEDMTEKEKLRNHIDYFCENSKKRKPETKLEEAKNIIQSTMVFHFDCEDIRKLSNQQLVELNEQLKLIREA